VDSNSETTETALALPVNPVIKWPRYKVGQLTRGRCGSRWRREVSTEAGTATGSSQAVTFKSVPPQNPDPYFVRQINGINYSRRYNGWICYPVRLKMPARYEVFEGIPACSNITGATLFSVAQTPLGLSERSPFVVLPVEVGQTSLASPYPSRTDRPTRMEPIGGLAVLGAMKARAQPNQLMATVAQVHYC